MSTETVDAVVGELRDLDRQRGEVLRIIKAAEDDGHHAAYERGKAYGLSIAIKAVERIALAKEPAQ